MAFKVFYLDDDPDICEVFVYEFSSQEIHIEAFTRPQEILDKVKNEEPDLIFLDYKLQQTNGDLVAQQMPAHLPKILITGDTSISTVYKFTAILSKPFENSDVARAMSSIFKTKKIA